MVNASTLGSSSWKKSPGWNRTRSPTPLSSGVLLKDRPHFGQIEPDSPQVRIGQRNLDRKVALRGAEVSEGPVFRPRHLARNGEVGAVADGGHRGQKSLQPRRIGIQRREGRGAGVIFCLVLRLPRAQRLCQVVPEADRDVRSPSPACRRCSSACFGPEKGLPPANCDSVLCPVEEAQRHQGIQKIAGGARMQSQPAGKFTELFRAVSQFGEDSHLDGAEQRLRAPEAQPYLQMRSGVGSAATLM